MFSKGKRIAAIFAATVLPIFSAIWAAVLSRAISTNGNEPHGAWIIYAPYLYVGTICIISASAAYFTHLKPVNDLEKPILRFLGVLAEKPLQLGKQRGIKPRMNLMIVYRPWYFLWRRRIRVVWSANMDSNPVRFSCFAHQGVCGRALNGKLPVLADCEVADKSAFKFSSKQLQQTAHVTAVWSWPIYAIDSKGQQTGSVTGVLNLDCTAPGAFTKLSANSVVLESYMKRFAETASTII